MNKKIPIAYCLASRTDMTVKEISEDVGTVYSYLGKALSLPEVVFFRVFSECRILLLGK